MTTNTSIQTQYITSHSMTTSSIAYQHRSAKPNLAWLPNKIATPLASPNDDKLDCLFTLEAAVPTTAAAVVVDLLVDLPIVPLLVFELLAMIVFSAAPLLCTGGMIIRWSTYCPTLLLSRFEVGNFASLFCFAFSKIRCFGVAVALQYGCRLQVSFHRNCIVGCSCKYLPRRL